MKGNNERKRVLNFPHSNVRRLYTVTLFCCSKHLNFFKIYLKCNVERKKEVTFTVHILCCNRSICNKAVVIKRDLRHTGSNLQPLMRIGSYSRP